VDQFLGEAREAQHEQEWPLHRVHCTDELAALTGKQGD